MKVSYKKYYLQMLFTLMFLGGPFQVNGTVLSVPVSTFATLQIDQYSVNRSGNDSWAILNGGIKLTKPESDICPENSCFSGFRWIQMIVTNAHSNAWEGTPPKIKDASINVGSTLLGRNVDDYMREMYYIYLDPWEGVEYHDSEPFYLNNSSVFSNKNGYYYAFFDNPRRSGDGIYYENKKRPLDWKAELALVGSNGKNISFLGSIKWGWERLGSNVYKDPGSLTFSGVSDELKQMVRLEYSDYQVVDNAYCDVSEPSIVVLLLAAFGVLLKVRYVRSV